MKIEQKNKNSEKLRAAGAILATAAMLIVMGLAIVGDGMQPAFLIISISLAVLGGCFAYLDFGFGRIASFSLYLFFPAAAFCALENFTHVLTDFKWQIVVLNLLFFYLLYGFFVFLTGRTALGYTIATLIPMIFGLANYFVVIFRSSPIVPWDLLSLRTAVSVADNYQFTLDWKAAFVLIAFIWMLLIASKCRARIKKRIIRIPGVLVFLLLMGIYIGGIQKSSVQSLFGMDTTLFTLNVLYRNNGIAAGFLGNLRFLNIEEPKGYSVAKVEEIEADVLQNKADTQSIACDVRPNIIVIMDEAFSDLSVWGDFETSEAVMPCFRKLQEEGVGGELYVSVKGGNTANTEFEFLTGNTMGFLPIGSVPYQQYINYETPSLASHLKSLGYATTAIHPYNASGWDRDVVYEKFGFDQFLSKPDFVNPLLMRGYISDQSAFEKIIEVLESNEEPSFIFEVTMQNHGGYSRETPDYDSYISFTGLTGAKSLNVQAAEKYLTLMRDTDKALENLVDYLSDQAQPTYVVMFGDHQPSDYITNVIKKICNVTDEDTACFAQQGYRVPFLIWSNVPMEHEYYEGISVNYLSSILMEKTGLPLTGYQRFLKQQMSSLPIINANAICDAEGVFYQWSDYPEKDKLNNYQILQYNHLVDRKHRENAFFGG